MDEEVIRFRQAADRENRRRHGKRRRYSAVLQQQAVEYWQRHRHHAGIPTIAERLGIAAWTLHRWTRVAPQRRQFRPIEVIAAAPAAATEHLVVTITSDGPRIEGLSVASAAQLLTLLR